MDNTFPWFKERLKTKYLHNLRQKQQLSGALDSHKWRFLSPGLDDFRDGYPSVHKELFTRCKRGPSPVVFGNPNHESSVKVPLKRLSKDQVCYSKQNPQSQTQRELIEAVEHKLKFHSLACHPHLENEMTIEVLLNSQKEFTTSPVEHQEESTTQGNISPRDTVKSTISIKLPKKKNNTYTWQGPVETSGEKEDQKLNDKQMQEDKGMIIKDLCNWMSALAGESSDLNESVFLELFKSDYEKKPTFPSPTLRTVPNQTPGKHFSSVELRQRHHCMKEAKQLSRPKTAGAKSRVDFIRNVNFEGEELKQTHAIQAFREFTLCKGLRMPRFLGAVFSEGEEMKIGDSKP
ncbi:hypothetical protein DNTS_021390 [Danionella cerebrum]|uniref:Uncharacterized protein n=1 Tax=Danionella cerebrum TaxID=2873325 RepID=A0A553R0Z9_9TELE|nr:hypothetical protein DNTS_021390 [Danionella translucida]